MSSTTFQSVTEHKGFAGRQFESIAHSHAVRDYLAVTSSVLYGNTWDGQVQLMMHRPGHAEGDLEMKCAANVGQGIAKIAWLNSLSVAMACDDGNVHIYSISRTSKQPDGTEELLFSCTLEEHDDVLTSVDVNRLTGLLASTGYDGTVKLWDVSRPDASVSTFQSNEKDPLLSTIIWDVKCCPHDTNLTAAATQSGCVRSWDTRSDEGPAWQVDLGIGATSLAWDSESANKMVVGLESGEVAWVDVRMVTGSTNTNSPTTAVHRREQLHSAPVHSVLSVTDNTVISGGDDSVVRVSRDRQVSPVEEGRTENEGSDHLLGEGEALVDIARDGVDTGLGSFKGHTDYVRGLSVRPQSSMVCTASWDGTLNVFDYVC